MNTTIEVICYKYKTLKNNEFPLKLRITHNRKRKYISLGVFTKLEDWDFTKNKPKPHCPNREYIEQIISDKINEVRSKVLELKATAKDYTTTTLLDNLNNSVKLQTFQEVACQHIGTLRELGRCRYADSIELTLRSLNQFNGHMDIYFQELDVSWLKRYEIWLRKEGKSENTIGIRFRNIRMLYNLAIEDGMVKQEHYPFKKYKVSKLHQVTPKRALTKEHIESIINYPSAEKGYYTELSIDIFTFSYLTGGINFVDMAYLTKECLVDNNLVYIRKKTSKLITLPLHPKAREILAKYAPKDERLDTYIFPILNRVVHKTEQQRLNRVHKVITKVNRTLTKIGDELNLPLKLTTYVARHSYATVLKRAGVSTALISESLGHSSERVTQIYLGNFENAQLDDAIKNLL